MRTLHIKWHFPVQNVTGVPISKQNSNNLQLSATTRRPALLFAIFPTIEENRRFNPLVTK